MYTFIFSFTFQSARDFQTEHGRTLYTHRDVHATDECYNKKINLTPLQRVVHCAYTHHAVYRYTAAVAECNISATHQWVVVIL